MVLPVIRSDEDPHVSVRSQRARPIGTSFADTILASGHVPHRKAGHTTAPDHMPFTKFSSCATAAVHTWLYADLKAYRTEPSPRRKAELKARFDRIFKHKTGFTSRAQYRRQRGATAHAASGSG